MMGFLWYVIKRALIALGQALLAALALMYVAGLLSTFWIWTPFDGAIPAGVRVATIVLYWVPLGLLAALRVADVWWNDYKRENVK